VQLQLHTREVEDGIQRIPAYFSTPAYDIDCVQQLDLQSVAADLSAQADHWNSRGSGFVLERIVKFVLCISKYRPLHGSTYIPTPQWLSKKQCVANVKNFDSNRFVWSVLSALHPAAHNPDRLSNYVDYENSLNISGLTFPLAVKDVPKFEKQNPSISVNVLCSGNEGGFVPLYVSKERDRHHHVNLFQIEGADESKHYLWVKNLSRLVAGRKKTHCPAFVCNHCLHPFRTKDAHDRHVLNCQRHAPQDVKYPDPENPKECTVAFHNKAARFRLPFYLVCDFESFQTPSEHGEDVDVVKATNIIDEHRVCGFACHRVSQYLEYQTEPLVYSGPGVMDKF